MSLDIRLVHHIDAVMVAKGIEFRVIRIVARTDGVDVVLLEQEHVLKHVLISYRPAIYRMDVMSVHSLEKHFFIIYVCMLSSDFHLSESVLGISGFNCLSVPA